MLPAEGLARGGKITALPTARPNVAASQNHAACSKRGARAKLLVEVINPAGQPVEGLITGTPTLTDRSGQTVAGLSHASVAFKSSDKFIAVDLTLGSLPDAIGLYTLTVSWKVEPQGGASFKTFTTTTHQHVLTAHDVPLDPARDSRSPLPDTGSGTHRRMGLLFSFFPKPEVDVEEFIWRLHLAINNSTPPTFYNALGLHITHNGDIKKRFDGKFAGTGVPLPLTEQWLMWVRHAGQPPWNRAACAGHVQLLKTMLASLGINVSHKLVLPVTNQLPPSRPEGQRPAPLALSQLTLEADVKVAPGGLDVRPHLQKATLRDSANRKLEAHIALMQPGLSGEYFEACAVTPAGKYLPGGFSSRRVTTTAPSFAAQRGFNSALEVVRWWTGLSDASGSFQRFMCWVATDSTGKVAHCWDLDGVYYEPKNYERIRDEGKQLPAP